MLQLHNESFCWGFPFLGCTNNVEIYGMIHAYNDPIIFDVSIEFLKKTGNQKSWRNHHGLWKKTYKVVTGGLVVLLICVKSHFRSALQSLRGRPSVENDFSAPLFFLDWGVGPNHLAVSHLQLYVFICQESGQSGITGRRNNIHFLKKDRLSS